MSFVINPYSFGIKGTVYEDDFSGAAGTALAGRSPNLVNVTGNTYIQNSGTFQLNGGGKLWAVGSGTGNAWARLALPPTQNNDVIVTELVLRPLSVNSNWIGVGLSKSSTTRIGDTSSGGVAWALLKGQTYQAGLMEVYSGHGLTGVLYSSSSIESGYNGYQSSTVKLTYTVSTGNLKVELGGIQKFNGPIAFGGVANTPAPLTAITHVIIHFANQNLNSFDIIDAGYIDYLKVSYL